MQYNSHSEALAALGLSAGASAADIKSAYHRMAAYYHPDAGMLDEQEATDAFLKLKEAYEYLMEASAIYETQISGQTAYGAEPVCEASQMQETEISPKILGNENALYEGSVSVEESGPRTIGGDAGLRAYFAQERQQGAKRKNQRPLSAREEAEERRRMEQRWKKRRDERYKRSKTEKAKEQELSYEEAMARIHAIRAAEIVAMIYKDLL